MDWYIQWVTENPMISAMIQFGILGTLGELISFWLREKRFALPCTLPILAGKIVAWAVLGIIIKYGFTGMRGFVGGLLEHKMLPEVFSEGILFAFILSVLTNILFGPQMMFFHRLEENLLSWRLDFTNIQKAWWTLLWFWIPAHTVTFSLPREYQIGLAAVWSVALGIIMGLSVPKAGNGR